MVTKVIKTASPSEALDISDLTTVALDGLGVFDRMLTLHRLALTREFTGGRIVGKEYSDAFIQTYIANLELSIRLVMEKEKQAYELELLEGQLDKLSADTLLTSKQTEIASFELTEKLPKEVEVMSAQITKMEADTLIAGKQLELLSKELELKTQMLPLEIALTTAQIAKMEADATLAEKQLLLADKELTLKDKELLLKDKELDLMAKQIILTEQKVVTEKAQTDPSVIEEGSVIFMNNKVLEAQVEGFKRDAEQKAANTLLQTWIVRLNNDAALTNDANMLKDKYVGRAVEKMMEGVGMSVVGKDETAGG